ncbi:MAG TPA: DNA cytosine methyltransferase, partial [Coleofasciculaceae cyanobacterium]
GFSLGIEQAGFDVAVAVEYDPIHAAVYAFNFPHTQVLCADVATLSGRDIKAAVSNWALYHRQSSHCYHPIDLVFGGPPCQGFSTIGKQAIDDTRNSLVFEFCRLVKELQPRYFVMENVPGLCQKKYQPILQQLMEEFKVAGYQLTEPVQVLNAVDFGVPQQRRRLFLLGTQVGEASLVYPQSQPCNSTFFPKELSEYITVKDAIADLPNLDDFDELHQTDSIKLTPTQLYKIQDSATPYVKRLRDLIPDPTNFAYSRLWNPQWLTSSMQTHHTEPSIERFKVTPPGTLEPTSRLRRLHWDKPCHTLRAGTGSERGSYTSPRPIHPQYPRVISVREAARLHSFPDWFRFHVTKWHGFREVGNAVVPLLARVLGRQIITTLQLEPSAPRICIALGDPQLLKFKHSQATQYWKLHKTRYPYI